MDRRRRHARQDGELIQMIDLGLDKLVLLGGGIGMNRKAARESRRMLAEQVLPKLR